MPLMATYNLIVCMCLCVYVRYLNDFLRQSGLQPLEMFPVRDEQLIHVTGCLSHCFVPKLDKQTNKQEDKTRRDQWQDRFGSFHNKQHEHRDNIWW